MPVAPSSCEVPSDVRATPPLREPSLDLQDLPVKCYCNPFALASFLFHFTTVVRVAGRVGAPPFTAAALGVSEVCEQQNGEVYRDDGCDGAEREKTKEAMERGGRSTAASLSLCSQAPPPLPPPERLQRAPCP